MYSVNIVFVPPVGKSATKEVMSTERPNPAATGSSSVFLTRIRSRAGKFF